MARSLFSTLGVMFCILALFAASFLGNVAVDLDARRPEYARHALALTRELARTWDPAAIDLHYADGVRAEPQLAFSRDIDALRLLGPLLAVDDVRTAACWSRSPGRSPTSSAAIVERLAALLDRAVRVSFVGRFAGGTADIVLELTREGGEMRLRRIVIDPRRKQEPQPARRVISHA